MNNDQPNIDNEYESPESALSSSYIRLIDGLNEVAIPDDVLTNTTGPITTADIFEAASIRICKLCALQSHAFLLANEDSEFEIYASYPEASHSHFNALIDNWIEDGYFSWALNQNRAVVKHDDEGVNSYVLHAIATRSRIIGMFIAHLSPDAQVDEGVLSLLSVVLMNCASGLESKELHTELKKHNENLETLIHERTEELEIAKNRAEQIATEKSIFLATMSHEIRTPMNGVIGMAQLLQKNNFNQEQQSLINTILQSGQALVHLIDDILDISKVEAGQLELDPAPFNIASLLKDAVELLKPQAAIKDTTIELLINEQVASNVVGDSGRIRQVILNLVGNAIKFTTNGTVKITVDPHKDKGLRVSVEDDGIGIRPEHIGRLFNPFSQSDATIARQHGGTGLGLSICKQLVELMGGEIGVDSEYEKGSVFWLTLELPPSDHSIISNIPAKELHTGDTSIMPAGKILIAEDNEINQKVISLMIKSLKIDYDIVDNGTRVLERLNSAPYDLILMDCQMPELDGYETTRIIRKSDKPYQQIPIIALTANAMKSDREECLASGMNDFIPKPINQENLNSILREWLNKKSVATTLDSQPLTIQNHDEMIDRAEILSLAEVMEDEFSALIEAFAQNSALKLKELSQALEAENSNAAREILHFLKGSCLSIGALQLSTTITNLETLAKQASLDEIERQLPALECCYHETIGAINQLIAAQAGL